MPRSTGRIGWYLPLLNGGEDKGLNDAGIENFHRTQHLARETVQNIIDAYDPRSKGIATAEFELTQIPRDSFPDLVQFTRFFHSCASRTAENDAGSRASQSSQFLRQGSTLLDPRRRHGIPVLRIRDRNTVGLSGDDQDRQSRWYRLVRGQGTSNIEGAGGGTYGIGQRAPFAFSSIRTILYSTMLPSGECRFMGKFILCTCLHPDHAKLTQNVGYFGEIDESCDERVRSITNVELIPPPYRRTEPGTDIYIMGFMLGNVRDSVAPSVLSNFFAAIAHKRLEVVIREDSKRTIISQQTIDQVLDAEVERTPKSGELRAAKYGLLALTEPMNGRPYEATIPILGTVQFFVARSPEATNRVCYMRSPRMKVYEQGSSKLRDFQAVLLVDSAEGSEYLAALEDPGHQRWDPEEAKGWSSSERNQAAEVLRNLRRFVRGVLDQIRGQAEADREDIPELAKLLPLESDDYTEFAAGGLDLTSTHQESESSREVERVTTPAVTVSTYQRQSQRQSETADKESGSQEEGDSGAGGGDGSAQGGHGGAGEESGPGDGILGGEERGGRKLSPSDARFRSWRLAGADNTYRLVLSPRVSVRGILALAGVGEREVMPVHITHAHDIDSGDDLVCQGGLIPNIELQCGEPRRLEVTIETDVELSLVLER